ncbi:MAG: YeeE/YedE family protein, partial [Deltaproteobacteria bacterium]|nr:YeeE/YedE family protein [Deltaproteobacteria bacterium]
MASDTEKKPVYWSNLVAGIGLGIILLSAYYIAGRGLGGSGAAARFAAAGMNLIAPEHTSNLNYFARYYQEGKVVLSDWLTFQLIGVFLGGLFGSLTAGRFKKSVDKGERISKGKRFALALIGGGLMGWG